MSNAFVTTHAFFFGVVGIRWKNDGFNHKHLGKLNFTPRNIVSKLRTVLMSYQLVVSHTCLLFDMVSNHLTCLELAQ